MQRRVVITDNQEVTTDDFTRLASWPQDGIDKVVGDFLLSGLGYTGLVVTANGQTAVDIAAGRLYAAGLMYASDATQNLSLTSYVPIVAGQQTYVTLVVQGREDDGFVEARNYEVEVTSSSGATTVQQTPATGARAKVRNAIVAALAGAASLSPVLPAVPLNTVAIADVLLGTGGIVSISRRTAGLIPELDELATSYSALSASVDLINQTIAGLRNDLTALAVDQKAFVTDTTVMALAQDVATLKDKASISDTGSPYGFDHFLDTTETDVANVDYLARIEEGIRFPYANFNKTALALYNPNDTNFAHANAGLICAKYDKVDGILVSTRASTMALGGTSYQTMELTQLSMSRASIAYGDYFTVCENSAWWSSGRYDAGSGTLTIGSETYEVDNVVGNYGVNGHQIYRVRRFWTTTQTDSYTTYAPVAHTIQGVIKSQSFLQSQDRWCPGVKLGIVAWGTGAEITATLVKCRDDGTPDPKQMLAKSTVGAASFSAFPTFTEFPFSTPVHLEKGLYAILWATTGDVTAATAEGQSFLGGTLFDSTDGVFFQGDLTRDLCFGVEFCQFAITRLTALLTGINLDGGIHDIKIIAAQIVPTNAAVTWQINVGGSWQSIGEIADVDTTLFGAGVSPYYDFRAILTGNEWTMPIIDMGTSEVTVFRAGAAFAHISTARQLASGVTTSTVVVKATVGDWDAARHTLVASLLTGVGYATVKTASVSTSKSVIGRATAREFTWTFNLAAPISDFKIKMVGTTNNARVTYHVEGRFDQEA